MATRTLTSSHQPETDSPETEIPKPAQHQQSHQQSHQQQQQQQPSPLEHSNRHINVNVNVNVNVGHGHGHTTDAQKNEENNINANPKEIVRGIASYLSLSDVESIGSLYSLISPTNHHHHHGHAHGQGHPQAHTPRYLRSYTSTGTPRMRNSGSTTSVSGSFRSAGTGTGTFNTGAGTGIGTGTCSRSGNGNFHGRHVSAATLESIDDTSSSDITSGPDAAAGVGIGVGNGAGFGVGVGVGVSVSVDMGGNAKYQQKWGSSETLGLMAASASPMPPIAMPLDEEEESVSSSASSTTSSIILSEHESREEHDTQMAERERTAIHLKSIQEKLKDAVFHHPQSIRSYCIKSQKVAKEMKMRRRLSSTTSSLMFCARCHMLTGPRVGSSEDEVDASVTPENEPYKSRFYLDQCTCAEMERRKDANSQHVRELPHERILHFFAMAIFDNIPLSVLFDISSQSIETSLQVTHASVFLTCTSADILINLLATTVHNTLDALAQNLNPMTLLSNILQLQRRAMGKTGEAIVTGIQSVATGVGSAGTACMHAFSKPDAMNKHCANGHGLVSASAGARSPRSGMVSVGHSLVEGLLRSGGTMRDSLLISDKMFRKLSKINPAAKVVKYVERDDEVLTKQAKKRVQRMMHYSVPLRPFVATVEVPNHIRKPPLRGVNHQQGLHQFGNKDMGNGGNQTGFNYFDYHQHFISERSLCDTDDESDNSFMCTPQSFPPTPSSRAHVLARGTRFAEDVVFLARDQLRVEEGLDSKHEQTRVMAKALREGKRLAVFNASDVGGGINLSCGQHCASKSGNDLYSTARGMIPVLRNSFVYFEMTVSTPPLLSMVLHHASLSIGLSTLEMPLNALVGAWKGSVGICSTGQILAGSQWCSPMNPKTYGSNCTIGCLVYLDDDSAFETWDGVVCTANVVFNVDGQVIIPLSPECTNNNLGKDIDKSQYSPVIPIFVPREEELFPTLTLHSSQTEVLCRFCAEDILATSRSAIGAPPGDTVYAVDGSVLFDDSLSSESAVSHNDDMSCSVESYDSFDSGMGMGDILNGNGYE